MKLSVYIILESTFEYFFGSGITFFEEFSNEFSLYSSNKLPLKANNKHDFKENDKVKVESLNSKGTIVSINLSKNMARVNVDGLIVNSK